MVLKHATIVTRVFSFDIAVTIWNKFPRKHALETSKYGGDSRWDEINSGVVLSM